MNRFLFQLATLHHGAGRSADQGGERAHAGVGGGAVVRGQRSGGVGTLEPDAASAGIGRRGEAWRARQDIHGGARGRAILRTGTRPMLNLTTPRPRVCMSIHPEGQSCSHLSRVLVLNDPPARSF